VRQETLDRVVAAEHDLIDVCALRRLAPQEVDRFERHLWSAKTRSARRFCKRLRSPPLVGRSSLVAAARKVVVAQAELFGIKSEAACPGLKS